MNPSHPFLRRRAGSRFARGLLVGLAALSTGHVAAASPARKLTVVPLASEPVDGRPTLSPQAEAELRAAIAAEPRERSKRLDLVMSLRRAGRLADALSEARAWREHDAYNLVAVRLIGDLLAELGDAANARRTYSAVVELLPHDVRAHRALATVLKQSGDLEAAQLELRTAAKLEPSDVRTTFELADTTQRLGNGDEAKGLFEQIVADPAAPETVAYPAKQRLAQILAGARITALAAGDAALAAAHEKAIGALEISGGVMNDIKIYLTWDTDRTDVDLWVTSPSGEKIFYSHKQGRSGEALYGDVTTGYGPESFTAKNGAPGAYVVEVNYYGQEQRMAGEARGEVLIVTHEGTPDEARVTLPYRLFEKGQTVTVARIEVK